MKEELEYGRLGDASGSQTRDGGKTLVMGKHWT